MLAAEDETVAVLTQALDYSDAENWAYFALGENKDADVFLISPTVDTKSYANALDLNDKLKSRYTGTVINYECEDGTLTDSHVIPAGTMALSINPLNWKTDGTVADRSLNLGAVMEKDAAPIPGLCGAYIGARGELVVTDVSPEDYPPKLSILQPGAYHVYDCSFFFTNLKNNVANRMTAWSNGTSFKDVSAGAWYTDAVKYVYDAGLMTGTSPTTFAPNGDLTRAQLVTILWRMENEPASDLALTFTDVPEGRWYTEAVRWAADHSLVTGYSADAFGPSDKVSREQLVTILYRYAQYKGMDVSVGEDTNILSYDDAFSVNSYAMPAMQWACGAGILTGKASGILAPKDPVTRAETAAMLTRLQAAPVI